MKRSPVVSSTISSTARSVGHKRKGTIEMSASIMYHLNVGDRLKVDGDPSNSGDITFNFGDLSVTVFTQDKKLAEKLISIINGLVTMHYDCSETPKD